MSISLLRDVSSGPAAAQELPGPINLELEASFRELICRLKDPEKATLFEKLDRLPNKEDRAELLREALEQGNFKHPIFSDPELPFYNLLAYKLGKITLHQFGTTQLFWSARQQHGDLVEATPIFAGGKPSAQAIEAIQESLTHAEEEPLTLTESEMRSFLRHVSQLPLSEQLFFTLPDIRVIEGNPTISGAIYDMIGINVLYRLSNNRRMIPSIGLMQAYLKAKFGEEQGASLHPVLGQSSPQQWSKKDPHDIAIPFPGALLPEKADGFIAPGYHYTYHDMYHALTSSSVPRDHREWVLTFAKLAEESREKFAKGSRERTTLNSLRFTAIDMECTTFIKHAQKPTGLPPETILFLELATILPKSFANPGYQHFDFSTAVDLYRTIAQKLKREFPNAKHFLEQGINYLEKVLVNSDILDRATGHAYAMLLEFMENPDISTADIVAATEKLDK